MPLDVRGTQLSVAFERAGRPGRGPAVSLAPCGFMRMRGSLAGPERVVPLAAGLSLLLPEGTLPGQLDLADHGPLAALPGRTARPVPDRGPGRRRRRCSGGWACGWRPVSRGRAG